MPHIERGMAIGLFGGSFNPPHEGHLLVAEIALQRLRLDQVWWMVTPGNPLKDHKELPPLEDRIKACEAMITDRRIKVTGFEKALGQNYTAATLDAIRKRNPHGHFVWLMGADNLENFHHWQKWREIACTYPIAVIDRPGATLSYLSSKMAKTFDYARVDENRAQTLAYKKAPAWTFIHGPRSPLSSSSIRAARKK